MFMLMWHKVRVLVFVLMNECGENAYVALGPTFRDRF